MSALNVGASGCASGILDLDDRIGCRVSESGNAAGQNEQREYKETGSFHGTLSDEKTIFTPDSDHPKHRVERGIQRGDKYLLEKNNVKGKVDISCARTKKL